MAFGSVVGRIWPRSERYSGFSWYDRHFFSAGTDTLPSASNPGWVEDYVRSKIDAGIIPFEINICALPLL